VIAIGDGHNDMPLLEAAGLKVAMGNAPDEVKQLADYVAPSLADDGVAAAIDKFVLSN
jgi:hydroxymethylpyrimidine pyrophosphatase-like HAD family hydrolase